MFKQNKFDTAIGYFWAGSLFIGVLISLLIGFEHSNWLEAGLIGFCVFLILELVISGIITLFKSK